jgi:hypothetical protein
MWGPPEFDSYTFLVHFANDGHSGDGMEHLTSTQIILSGALGDPGTVGRSAGHCVSRILSRVECESVCDRLSLGRGTSRGPHIPADSGSPKASQTITAT